MSQTCWESQIESVKVIKFQALEIRDALLQLAKTSEDPKTKSEADCLATYELESFEFLLGSWKLSDDVCNLMGICSFLRRSLSTKMTFGVQ